nr:trithorax group protein osa-like [Macaca fascicularis]
MAEETRQSKLALAKRKVKMHQVMAPQPSHISPLTTRPLPESISLLRHTKLGPPTPAPLGCPHQSLVNQPCPFSKKPSPCPHQSPQGDFGCVTTGASHSITGLSPPAYPNLTSLGSLGSRFQAPGSPSPRPHPRQLSLGDFGLVIPGAPYCRLGPPLLLPQGQTPWALCAGVCKDLGPNPVFPSPIVEWDSDIALMCPTPNQEEWNVVMSQSAY